MTREVARGVSPPPRRWMASQRKLRWATSLVRRARASPTIPGRRVLMDREPTACPSPRNSQAMLARDRGPAGVVVYSLKRIHALVASVTDDDSLHFSAREERDSHSCRFRTYLRTRPRSSCLTAQQNLSHTHTRVVRATTIDDYLSLHLSL